ncbi:WXG100 family type VII secretion target [Streptomyces sp. NPDC006552]|uniref:WXG100 family type VII secretion target n=1 Tax=Streptomyces sp. NPDC006552 TaxID=3157179 RepID=UPI00339E5807
MTESTTDRRKRLDGLRGSVSGAGSKNDLIDAIDDALGVAAPEGDPATIESLGKRYRGQADDAMKVHDRSDAVSRKGLPNVWVGDTSVLAATAVDAATRAAEQMADALRGGGNALITLADALEAAQTLDGTGRTKLRDARGQLGDKDGFFDTWHEDDGEEAARKKARALATTGVDELYDAAVAADDAARAAARDLNKYAAEARAGKMDTDELSAVDRLALADTSNVSGDPEWNEILSANDLERSGQAMENLSPAERARMERLLAQASSPQEKAYLMKALASGHSVDDVETFGGKIHGKDPMWLQEHLAPVTTETDSMDDEGRNADGSNKNTDRQDFAGQGWTQGGDGQEGSCVASSTVTARAMVDPVYALGLTGGPSGQENDAAAFRERLVDEQHRVHEEGDGDHTHFWTDVPDGMDNDGKTEVVNKEISPHTGSGYDFKEVKSADDRRDVLPDIERSVAEGKPVPVGIEGYDDGDRSGHAVMIVGQEGDMLQVYNPWGTTTWISEDDFVNGGMAKASDNDLPDAYAVHVPED